MRNTCQLALIALLWSYSSTVAQDSSLSAEQRERNQQSFDKVWQTIRDNHWDPKLGGLDWQKVRAEFEPKTRASAGMAEFRRHVNEMIDRKSVV